MHTRPESAKYLLERNGAPSAYLGEKIERKQAIQQLFQPRDVNQSMLLTKINIYLAQQKRPLLNPFPGYCHGLTLLWLYKCAEGKVQWFYDVIDKIVSSTPSNLQRFDADLEKFIAYIDYGQNSAKYTRQFGGPCVSQSDVDKILRIPRVEARSQWFSYPDFYRFLDKRLYQNEMIVLSCFDRRVMHTIGVFVSGPLYYLYDSNSPSGRPTVFSSPLPLIHGIRRCFYGVFDQAPPLYYMPLETHVLKSLALGQAEQKAPSAMRGLGK